MKKTKTTTKTKKSVNAGVVSLIGAFLILIIKFGAYALTGSVSLLSDAAESVVNLVAAIALIIALRVAAQPADYEHQYGHSKAEYLSAVFESALIVVAAGVIIWQSIGRLLNPIPLESLPIGLLVAGIASVLNAALAIYLGREGRRTRSAALQANARHIYADVFTSVGVILGVMLVGATNIYILDPIIALLVAVHILFVGYKVMTRSLSGLLDKRLSDEDEALLISVIQEHPGVLGFHRLRTRRAGRDRFAEVDIFVDPNLRVGDGHDIAQSLEHDVAEVLPGLKLTGHVEPFVPGERDSTRTPREEFPT